MSSSYETIRPIAEPVAADRQAAKRHYGVHPYFTRRPFNLVRKYVLHYSREGDRVLDPFGGSGVTAIEAFLENRTGIQNDINPLANFIAKGVADLSKGDLRTYTAGLEAIRQACERQLNAIADMSGADLAKLTRTLRLPPNVALPSNADVQRYHDLFSPRQLASLVVLREAVESVPNRYARDAMRMAWSATLAKLNRTFLSAEGRAESRGGSSIFSIYRYKVAAKPVELAAWDTFCERAQNILAAKVEIDRAIAYKQHTGGFVGRFEVYAYDIEDVPGRVAAVDYIFTDPPYGGHISYIDLSTLWNAWNGHLPCRRTRQRELIVGGDLGLSEDLYVSRLHESIRTCFALLKPRRWLSVVFQHWRVPYFNAILTGAAAAGGDLRAAISQVGDPVWSMHKKKGNESVLAGEMILTFFKTARRRAVEANKPFDIAAAVASVLRNAPTAAIYGEYIFNRIVIDAWRGGALGSLDIPRAAFAALIEEEGWEYDEHTHQWRKKGRRESLLSALS
ncbi:MAG: hypothetical protein HYX76_08060 [Acidobacteria bacterium]|nr:hypothetical protein [Acidobacteriota bacterium]